MHCCGRKEMRQAFARTPEIPHLQLGQFLAPQRTEKQRRKEWRVAPALDGFLTGRFEQLARLMVADRRVDAPSGASFTSNLS
jgi:hypothetical protein